MDLVQILFLSIYSAVTIAGIFFLRRTAKLSPSIWFMLANWLMAVGTFVLLDTRRDSDVYYGILYIVALVSFLGGIFLFYGTHNVRSAYQDFWKKTVVSDPPDVRSFFVTLLILSAMISYLYYAAIGYNLAFQILSGADLGNYNEARLMAYSGDNYFAPGYVNQFKNVILPVTASIFGMYIAVTRSRKYLALYVLIAVPLVFLALAGTGQRAFVLYSFFALLFGLSAIKKIPRKFLWAGFAAILSILFVMTGAYKGSEDGSIIWLKIAERFVIEQQFGGLAGFRYVYGIEVSWLREWGQNFIGILPGYKGSLLPHLIHQELYGSDIGTVPLSIVGSAYHNGGIVLVVAYFSFLGWIFSFLHYRFLKGRRTIVRCFTYGALFFYLAVHVAGTPVSLINNGAVALLGMLMLRKARWDGLFNNASNVRGLSAGRTTDA